MAVKQLELYVEVADGAGPQSMARACSAIGTMYNTLVGHSLHQHTCIRASKISIWTCNTEALVCSETSEKEISVKLSMSRGVPYSKVFLYTLTPPLVMMQGDYGKAVDFFGRCYQLCSELNDPAALHEARAQYGIARGHQMFDSYATAVCTSLSGDLERLIMWKDERGSVEERTVEDTGTGTGDEDGDNDEKEDEEEEEEEEEEKDKNVKDTEQDSEETT